jgi:hypothetical protein
MRMGWSRNRIAPDSEPAYVVGVVGVSSNKCWPLATPRPTANFILLRTL